MPGTISMFITGKFAVFIYSCCFFRKLLCNPRSRLRYPAFLSHCDQALHSINPSLLPDSEHHRTSVSIHLYCLSIPCLYRSCASCSNYLDPHCFAPDSRLPGFWRSWLPSAALTDFQWSPTEHMNANADRLPDLLPFFVPRRYDTSPYQVSKRFGSSALPRQWLLVDMNINEAHRHSERSVSSLSQKLFPCQVPPPHQTSLAAEIRISILDWKCSENTAQVPRLK